MSDSRGDHLTTPFEIRRSTWSTTFVGVYFILMGLLCGWFSTEIVDPSWRDESPRLFGLLMNELPPFLRFAVCLLISAALVAIGAIMLADVVRKTPIVVLEPSGVTWRRIALSPLKAGWDKVTWGEGYFMFEFYLDGNRFSMAYFMVDRPRDEIRSAFARFTALDGPQTTKA